MKFSVALFTTTAIVAAGGIHAFVAPTGSSPTFLPTSRSTGMVPTQETNGFRQGVTSPYQSHTTAGLRGSSTALQANLVDRFMRVAKANMNNILINLEGPEKIMNQAVEDMQSDLIKIRQTYAEVTATQRRLAKQKETAEAIASDWYNRAQLALKTGNEKLAKAALTRRQEQLEIVRSVQSQLDVQTNAMDKLYEGMQVLEGKILEAKQKKAQFVARAKTAESTQKVNDMLSGMTGKTSMDAFKRMEEKVEALEAAAEVSAEITGIGGNMLPGSVESDLENEFLLMEGSAAVDKELEKLKKNLLTGSTVEKEPEFVSGKRKESKRVPVEWIE